jgi:hypothetical protein
VLLFFPSCFYFQLQTFLLCVFHHMSMPHS